jgi:hypothetical protein
MWGYDGDDPRVFVENKFWADLTANQPCSYLGLLEKHKQPSILLFVVPDARQQTIWRELTAKLKDAGIRVKPQIASAGISFALSTDSGPILALTSWPNLISTIESAAAEDDLAKSDLFQLRALCRAADTDLPITESEVRDQRTPALLLQLGGIIRDAVEMAIDEKCLHKGRLQRQADWERVGQYACLRDEKGAGIWLGLHFGLWRTYGGTPLWAIFSTGDWGRAREVRMLLEPWAASKGVFTATHDDESFIVALDIPFGEEKRQVVSAIVSRLKEMAESLAKLNPKT